MKKTTELKEALKNGDYSDLLLEFMLMRTRLNIRQSVILRQLKSLKNFMVRERQLFIVLREEVRLEETIQITSMVKFLRRLSILTLLQLQEKLMTI